MLIKLSSLGTAGFPPHLEGGYIHSTVQEPDPGSGGTSRYRHHPSGNPPSTLPPLYPPPPPPSPSSLRRIKNAQKRRSPLSMQVVNAVKWVS